MSESSRLTGKSQLFTHASSEKRTTTGMRKLSPVMIYRQAEGGWMRAGASRWRASTASQKKGRAATTHSTIKPITRLVAARGKRTWNTSGIVAPIPAAVTRFSIPHWNAVQWAW